MAERYGWTYEQIDEMKDEDVDAILIKLNNDSKEREISRLEMEQEIEARRQAREMARGRI